MPANNANPPPVIVIPAWDKPGEFSRLQSAKYFASSLLRGMFSGRIVILRDAGPPVFKIRRTGVEEIVVERVCAHDGDITDEAFFAWFLGNMEAWITPHPDQWVMIAPPATLALRNIDHLFPLNDVGPYSAATPNFLHVQPDHPTGGKVSSWTPEFPRDCLFAVRGKSIPHMTGRGPAGGDQPAEPLTKGIWTSGFEWGEVLHPCWRSLKWDAVCRAAIISMAGWPDEPRKVLTRSLYLGLCMGSEMEIMLHLTEM